MKIPLAKILKGKFLRIAEMQDLAIIEIAKNFDFVLHGGTAIWRIYGGKRFSFDIDIYYKNPQEIAKFFESSKLFKLTKLRKTSSNVVYLKIKESEEIEIEISPLFKKLKTTEKEFWLTDGTSIIIKTLPPEELIKEKISAFINRKKSRDLYDIFYLLDFCDKNKIRNNLKKLLYELEKPKDFEGLRELILLGKSPSFETIKEKVIRYAKG